VSTYYRKQRKHISDILWKQHFQRAEYMASVLLVGVAIVLSLAYISAQPAPGCQTHCGDVEIPYPFGIVGTGCALEKGFEINCSKTVDGEKPNIVIFRKKPNIVNIEVLNISVSHGKTRVLNRISTYCYNPITRKM
ncbi:hypothetical protein EJB05_30521, partial [Eragrostis curvula]